MLIRFLIAEIVMNNYFIEKFVAAKQGVKRWGPPMALRTFLV